MTRKRGKLSKGEMDYIRQNCFDLSLEEIADNIERTVETVRKFIDKENLKARNMTDDEYMLTHLRDRYYYAERGKQFSDGEIIFGYCLSIKHICSFISFISAHQCNQRFSSYVFQRVS